LRSLHEVITCGALRASIGKFPFDDIHEFFKKSAKFLTVSFDRKVMLGNPKPMRSVGSRSDSIELPNKESHRGNRKWLSAVRVF
jgi:hypothetical protein